MRRLDSNSAVLGVRTKLAYGVGAVAYGVKNNGFDYYILIFYSQVVGLDAHLAGIALFIALFFDAISDPVIGYWSDNLHSRWGRRHPFMYASAIPVAASYFLLWSPSVDWSQTTLFAYLLGLSVLIRTFITMYETPSSALSAELTHHYEERSLLMSYRYYFSWTGGNLMNIFMFFVAVPLFTIPGVQEGLNNPASYEIYGIFGSILMLTTIIISAAGTQSTVQHLNAPPPRRSLTLLRIFKELIETLANRDFMMLFLSAIFGAIAQGLAAALNLYFTLYFWEFTTSQAGILSIGYFASAIFGFFLAPRITRWVGKKRGAILIGILAFVGSPLPIVLRLLDVLPPNGEPSLFIFVLTTHIIDYSLLICFQILVASMVADLVEQSELKTGRRSEGVFFAAITFVRKTVQGLGILAASAVLALAHFPTGADVAMVTDSQLFNLGLYYVPSVLALWILMTLTIGGYRISKSSHEETLKLLGRTPENAE